MVEQGELLDWTSARLYGQFVDGARLVVEGETPVPMRVELDPLPIGIVPVDYQGVELRGFRSEIEPQVETPFELSVDTREIPHGQIGFVLIGATQREYFPARAD